MESSLEVLSRAVTMIQDSEVEKLTTKEKQTKRHNGIADSLKDSQYHSLDNNHHPHSHHYMKQRAAAAMNEAPLDMTISSKHRRTPPPPYPYKQIELTKAARPSVITKAPRIITDFNEGMVASNNKSSDDNSLPQQTGDSIPTCDTVIDEHFRRSLGNNYFALLTNEKTNKLMKMEIPPSPTPSSASSTASNGVTHSPAQTPPPLKSPATYMAPAAVPVEVVPIVEKLVRDKAPTPPVVVEDAVAATAPEPTRQITIVTNDDDDEDNENEISVDDHFAKALGNDMWKKIQEKSLKS